MSEEKVYPYIGRGSESGSIVMFYSQGNGITLNSKSWASENMEYHRGVDESYFKNITREFLQNTYGEVLSHEHAEFIIELAKVNNLRVYPDFNEIKAKFFTFNKSSALFFYCNESSIDKNRCKQITIPLPPTKSSSASKVNRDIERAVKAKISDELGQAKSKKEEQLIDGNKYHREIIGLDGTKTTVDVYRVLDAFKTGCPATDHAIKKMLCAGLRGHKDKVTDYDNAIESLQAARLLLMQRG